MIMLFQSPAGAHLSLTIIRHQSCLILTLHKLPDIFRLNCSTKANFSFSSTAISCVSVFLVRIGHFISFVTMYYICVCGFHFYSSNRFQPSCHVPVPCLVAQIALDQAACNSHRTNLTKHSCDIGFLLLIHNNLFS